MTLSPAIHPVCLSFLSLSLSLSLSPSFSNRGSPLSFPPLTLSNVAAPLFALGLFFRLPSGWCDPGIPLFPRPSTDAPWTRIILVALVARRRHRASPSLSRSYRTNLLCDNVLPSSLAPSASSASSRPLPASPASRSSLRASLLPSLLLCLHRCAKAARDTW